MAGRSTRVNELIKREISLQMHSRFQHETVFITITDVDTSPDLRHSKIFYSVIGEEENKKKAKRFFSKNGSFLRQLVSKQITLKYFPQFRFIQDDSQERGTNIINLLDELDD